VIDTGKAPVAGSWREFATNWPKGTRTVGPSALRYRFLVTGQRAMATITDNLLRGTLSDALRWTQRSN
jgi:hypothetical protein